MKKNMGSFDRGLRLLAAMLLVAIYASDKVSGGWAVAALVVAGILALTSIFGFCPLYLPFGISTRKHHTVQK